MLKKYINLNNFRKLSRILFSILFIAVTACCHTPKKSEMEKENKKSPDIPIYSASESKSNVFVYSSEAKIMPPMVLNPTDIPQAPQVEIQEIYNESKFDIGREEVINNIEQKNISEPEENNTLPEKKVEALDLKKEGLEVLPKEILNAPYKILVMGINGAGKTRLLNKLCVDKRPIYNGYSDETCITQKFVAYLSATYPDLAYIEAPPFFCCHNDLEDDLKKNSIDGYAHCIDRALAKQKWPVELSYNLILHVMDFEIHKPKNHAPYGDLGKQNKIYDQDKDENGLYCGYRSPFALNYDKTLHVISKKDYIQADTNLETLRGNIRKNLLKFWPDMEGPYFYGIGEEDYHHKTITEIPELLEIEKEIYDKASHINPFKLEMDEEDRKERERFKEKKNAEETEIMLIKFREDTIKPWKNKTKANDMRLSFNKIMQKKWSEKKEFFIENFISPDTMEFAFYLLEAEKEGNIISNVCEKMLKVGFKKEGINFSIEDLKNRNFLKVNRIRNILRVVFDSVNHKIRDEFLKITQEEEQDVKEYYNGDKESRKAWLAAERMKYKKTKEQGDQIASVYKEKFHQNFEKLAKDAINEYEIENKTKLEPFMLEFVAEWLYDFYLDNLDNFVSQQIEHLQKNNKIEDLLEEFIKIETENMKKWLSKEHYLLRKDTGLPVKTEEEMEQLKLDLTLNLSSVQNIFEKHISDKFEDEIAYILINSYISDYVEEYVDKYIEKNYNGKLPYSEYAILEALNSKTIEKVNEAVKFFCEDLKNKKVETKIIKKIENNSAKILEKESLIEDILEKVEHSAIKQAINVDNDRIQEVKNHISKECFKIRTSGSKDRKNLASKIAEEICEKKYENEYIFTFLQKNVKRCWLNEDFWDSEKTEMSYNQWHQDFLPNKLTFNRVYDRLLTIQLSSRKKVNIEILNKDSIELTEIFDDFLKKEMIYRINLIAKVCDQYYLIEHFGSIFDEEKKTKQDFKMPETLTYLELVDFVIDFVINISIENLSEENVPENIINQIKEIVKNLKKEKNITSKTNSENSFCEIT